MIQCSPFDRILIWVGAHALLFCGFALGVALMAFWAFPAAFGFVPLAFGGAIRRGLRASEASSEPQP